MTDTAFETAKAKREQLLKRKTELRKERAFIDAQLNDVDKFIALYESFAAGVADTLEHFANTEGESPAVSPKRRRIRPNSKKEDVAEAARVVIAQRGEPVMRSEMFKELIRQGYKIEGSDAEMVLSTMLWRMKDHVIRLRGGGYWLPERPWEPANYEPTKAVLKAFNLREACRMTIQTGRGIKL